MRVGTGNQVYQMFLLILPSHYATRGAMLSENNISGNATGIHSHIYWYSAKFNSGKLPIYPLRLSNFHHEHGVGETIRYCRFRTPLRQS